MRNLLKAIVYGINAPLIKKRLAYRNSLPNPTLSAEHVRNCKVIPDRESLLALMSTSAVVAELGVADGSFSEMILEITRPRRLVLVDSWHTKQYAPDEKDVRALLETKGLEDIVQIKKGFSTEVLKGFPDNVFDWIYIDTNHSYETTRDELSIAMSKVKSGGRILGHDYCLGNIVKPAVFGVIPAVHEFCIEHHWEFEFITLESNGFNSFCLRQIDGTSLCDQ